MFIGCKIECSFTSILSILSKRGTQLIKSWSVNLDNQQYAIELEHGFFSGNRLITVNGEVVHKSRKFFDSGTSEHSFSVGSHSGKIVIRVVFNINYKLYIDGTPYEAQKMSTFQMLNVMPFWGWLLVVAMTLYAFMAYVAVGVMAKTAFSFRGILILVAFLAGYFGMWVTSGNRKLPLWQRLSLSLLLALIYYIVVMSLGCSCQFQR
jgi:hypothetical protein